MTKICLQPRRGIIFLEVGKRNNFIDTELLQIAYRDSVELLSYTQVQLQCCLHDYITSILWFRKPVACETTPHCWRFKTSRRPSSLKASSCRKRTIKRRWVRFNLTQNTFFASASVNLHPDSPFSSEHLRRICCAWAGNFCSDRSDLS